jgi:hypothetical protein
MLFFLSFAFGCMHLPADSSRTSRFDAPNQSTLGWRLVPGQSLSYAHRVRLLRGQGEVGREEHWTYLVKDVDAQGVALLEGRLTGFGALVVSGSDPVDTPLLHTVVAEERERMEGSRVWIRLSPSGQIQSIEGLSWEQSLSHGLLGLSFRNRAVSPGEAWPDPGMLAPLLNLISPRVAVLPKGTQTLVDLGTESRPATRIQSEGSLVLGGEDTPALSVSGVADWDLQQGALVSRRMVLSLRQYESDFGSRLILEIERQQ